MSSGAPSSASSASSAPRGLAADVLGQVSTWPALIKERWVQATPHQQRLVTVALILAMGMVVALYLTLTDSMGRVERKLAADADLAKWRRFCTTLSKPRDRQQCLVEVQARVSPATAGAEASSLSPARADAGLQVP